MPFERPTLQQISQRVQADFVRIYNDGKPLKVRSIAYVLSQAITGLSHSLHGHLDFIAKQMFPDSCTPETLLKMALSRGVTRRPTTHALGLVLFQGRTGVRIRAGTELVREDGVIFRTFNEGAITQAGCEIQTKCNQPGTIGNTISGHPLTLVHPIPGVMHATSRGIQNGFDEESHEALLSRVLTRMRSPIRGGTKQDFIQWSLEVPGVKAAWAFAHIPSPGHVTLTFIKNDVTAFIPNPEIITQVKNYLEARKPILSELHVIACNAHPIQFTIRLRPENQALQARIENSLKALLFEKAEPHGKILHAHILAAITEHLHGEDFTLHAPVADVQAADRTICTYGEVKWI